MTESSKRKGYSVLLTCLESTEDSNRLYMQVMCNIPALFDTVFMLSIDST